MTDPRAATLSFLRAVLRDPSGAAAGLAPDCDWQASAPLAPMTGAPAVEAGFWGPLRAAFTGLHRRDEIFIGGPNRRQTGGWWCASVTHYVGNFTAPLWGIAPSGHLAFLRAGEFYRIEEGRITQARFILDLPDLLRQCGRHPFPFSYGLETLFPGPATHDGVLPATGDGSRSLDIVEGMLGALHVFDPESFASANQTGTTGFWHQDMMWYGPAGIGSNFRWEGFVKDHREPFLRAFPDRKGGNHYCRIGDGNYAAVSGWPSMTMTFQGDYLGARADGRPLTLRVMDFYRCTDTQIAENWVFLDYVDLFAQMGIDLLQQRPPG
jgi:predicted ester cyclase